MTALELIKLKAMAGLLEAKTDALASADVLSDPVKIGAYLRDIQAKANSICVTAAKIEARILQKTTPEVF